MSQQTLGIVSIQAKNQFLREIYKHQVVTERQFDLSVKSAQQILKLDISETQSVYGFILEGPNTIEDWYNVVTRSAARSKRFIVHGSSNPDNAHRETDWFQNLLLNDASSASSSSSAKKLSKKKVTGSPVTKSTISGTQQRKAVSVRSTPMTTTTTKTSTTKTGRTKTSSNTTKPTTRSKIPSVKPPVSNTARSNMTTTARTNQKSVTPINKRSWEATTTTGTTRRGSSATSSLPATTPKKLLSTTSRGGVSKNTPPVSIITGRTRKPSRLTEKRPTTTAMNTATTKNKTRPIAIEELPVEDEAIDLKVAPAKEEVIAPMVKEESVDAIFPKEEPAKETTAATEEPVEPEMEATVTETPEEEDDQEFVNVPPPPVSHPSTCSSAATDEHDAEVAAATQKRPVVVDSFAFTNSGRSSFSPNSVASLPRPETPEVDQLRLKFETIIQTTTPVEPQALRRPSSKMSLEFVSRIKEMKPRGPAGTRVKSMVELFMDENLNKWEF